jgi:predicted nucleotidyltransferase
MFRFLFVPIRRILRSRWGRFVLFRNLLVGWLTHSLQDRDRSEVVFHLLIEGTLLLALSVLLFFLFPPSGVGALTLTIAGAFLLAHTIMFIADGQLHCYLHEAIESMQNAGVDEAINYMGKVKQTYSDSDAIDAVLVYGSFCRRQFRLRSDLDIRVVRRPGAWYFLKSIIPAFKLRYCSVFRRLPTDLLVVDSMDFVRRQMRKDEFPVVLVLRDGFAVPEAGLNLEDIAADPTIVMRT